MKERRGLGTWVLILFEFQDDNALVATVIAPVLTGKYPKTRCLVDLAALASWTKDGLWVPVSDLPEGVPETPG